MDPKNGHVNGTKYVLENITNEVLYLRSASVISRGAKLVFPLVSSGPGDDLSSVLAFKRL